MALDVDFPDGPPPPLPAVSGPDDLADHDNSPKCPKCASDDVGMEWRRPFPPMPDWLLVSCETCGYLWGMFPADA